MSDLWLRKGSRSVDIGTSTLNVRRIDRYFTRLHIWTSGVRQVAFSGETLMFPKPATSIPLFLGSQATGRVNRNPVKYIEASSNMCMYPKGLIHFVLDPNQQINKDRVEIWKKRPNGLHLLGSNIDIFCVEFSVSWVCSSHLLASSFSPCKVHSTAHESKC